MKKAIIRIFEIAIILVILLGIQGGVQAQSISTTNLPEQLEEMDNQELLELFDKFSEEYTNEEMAELLEENSEVLQQEGISEEVIKAGADFIRTTDTETMREIIQNNVDIDDIKNKVEQGYTPNEILTSMEKEMPTEQKVGIVTQLFFANVIVKTIIKIYLIWLIIGTIFRWIIYKKAGKHGFVAIIPVYRQITMYKICGLSPWLMLLWLVPIIGWIVLFIIAIMKRFSLAHAFGRGTLFGFGLLILPPIFQGILAFNPNIVYEGE